MNYQKKLEETLSAFPINHEKPTLVLHSCCAPCSTYVLQYLAQYFYIQILFYNPNIFPENEYVRRFAELNMLIEQMGLNHDVVIVEVNYDAKKFYDGVSGLEREPEGGARCEKCFTLRLEETAKKAAELKAAYFTTTLTISPHKNANMLNEIGQFMEKKYGVPFLCSDFKKKEGFKQSLVLSDQYGLYRQDYCGCVFSQKEREKLTDNSQ